jgi:hypothetical protein
MWEIIRDVREAWMLCENVLDECNLQSLERCGKEGSIWRALEQ